MVSGVRGLLRTSAGFQASSQAKFTTDPFHGLMRVMSPDKVQRKCEVVEDTEVGLPRLKVNITVCKELGVPQAGWEAAVVAFDSGAVRSS